MHFPLSSDSQLRAPKWADTSWKCLSFPSPKAMGILSLLPLSEFLGAVLRMASRGRKSTRAEFGCSPCHKEKWPWCMWLIRMDLQPPGFRMNGNEIQDGNIGEQCYSGHSEHKSCRSYKADAGGRAVLPQGRLTPHRHTGSPSGVALPLLSPAAPQPQSRLGSL